MKRRVSRLLVFLLLINTILAQSVFGQPIYKDYEDISAWALDYVVEATDKKIVSGFNGYFNPKREITRAEFTKLIVEILDLDMGGEQLDFKDVKKSDWFYDYVKLGASNHIIKGSNGRFNPNGNISREEMAVIISRALELGEYGQVELRDFKDISSWAIEDVNRVVDRKLIMGSDGYFKPKDRVSREMAAVVIMRAYDYDSNKIPEEEKNQLDREEVSRRLEKSLGYIKNNVKEPTVASMGGEWSVMGLNLSKRDLDPNFNKTYMKNLIDKLDEKDGELHSTRYTEYSRIVLALNSMGEDPRNLAGYNLEERIEDIDKVKKQGINGPIFSLLALNSRDKSKTLEKQLMLDYILEREIQSGGWALSSDIEKGDIDVTAMAIQALSAFKDDKEVNEAIERGLDFLSREQEEDGGYTSWNSKNSENASQVIIALTSVGIDPYRDPRFIKNGNSLLDFLLTYQDRTGGFKHQLDGKVNLMASEQGLLALLSYEKFLDGEGSLYDMSFDR